MACGPKSTDSHINNPVKPGIPSTPNISCGPKSTLFPYELPFYTEIPLNQRPEWAGIRGVSLYLDGYNHCE